VLDRPLDPVDPHDGIDRQLVLVLGVAVGMREQGGLATLLPQSGDQRPDRGILDRFIGAHVFYLRCLPLVTVTLVSW
jgi:hypothetical protein